mgnify:CR=1 FL=1
MTLFLARAVLGLVLSLNASLVGCGPALQVAFEKVAPIPEGRGMLYIYQDPLDPYSDRIDIQINGKDVSTLRPRGYFSYVVNPGEVTLAGTKKFSMISGPSITLDVNAGQVRYVKLYRDWGRVRSSDDGSKRGWYHLVEIPVLRAEKEIIECRLVPVL